MKNFYRFGLSVVLLGSVLALAACDDQPGDSQSQGQQITESYAKKLTVARPYPLAAMNDSAERANLTERLLRMNDPNKIGYVYEIAPNSGSIIQYFTIKGKVSSTESQLTNTQNIENECTGYCPVAVDSMGDDGSYGPEEGGANGVFFFTTSGVLEEWNGTWLYSDAPLSLTSPPLITMSIDAKPSSTAHILGSAPAKPAPVQGQ